MIVKHTLKTANEALDDRFESGFLEVVSIEGQTITLKDVRFGEYKALLKALAPSSKTPIHPLRRKLRRMIEVREKHVGQTYSGLTITDAFYGPERGYKNRSFYFQYSGVCGHTCVSPLGYLIRSKKTLKCARCCFAEKHGARKRYRGVLKKRDSEYIAWIAHKARLASKYRGDYLRFKEAVGDRPSKRSRLVVIAGEPSWECREVSADKEIDLIASAVRQVFRRSKRFKGCLQAARVQTPKGVKYECAMCKKLHHRRDVQVDHVDPIKSLTGAPLMRSDIFARVWDAPIQILDKACHVIKTKKENAIRKEAKTSMERAASPKPPGSKARKAQFCD